MALAPAWKKPRVAGPVVWWLRNDLRLEDNPVARAAVAEALTDQRPLLPIFIFDPRFLDRSPYGRVTDPDFKKSISTRKPVDFGSRKTNALRARFWLQCVRCISNALSASGSRLLVCHGKPEEVLASLPTGSLVLCQSEPVSPEQTDVEDGVAAALADKHGEIWRKWGAMSLYHRKDLPFRVGEAPGNYTELALTLGWEDLWRSPGRTPGATPIRSPVAAPQRLPQAPDVELPGIMPAAVLADDREALKMLGYSPEEVEEAMVQKLPAGGEVAARDWLEKWLREEGEPKDLVEPVLWDLPTGGVTKGHDALQWANLARPDGWLRVSHYMAVGCISAREILARAEESPNYNGVAHRLLWRELHRFNAIRWGRRLFWLQGPGRVERPWSWDTAAVEAWKAGRTGVPYVDACMRELQQTGWLAYKGRKTVGFYFVFILGLDWRIGAFHFEEVLLDYDVAMNYGNWVVVAEVDKSNRGAHGFKSVEDLAAWKKEEFEWKLSAEKKNDAAGEYLRRWLPELSKVDAAHIHEPWKMSAELASRCGCELGRDYPHPLGGPFNLREENEDTERRMHPNDSSGALYTYKQFVDFALSKGYPASFGKKCWEQAQLSSSCSLQEQVTQLQGQLEAAEQQLRTLRGT
ncbi:unnamed protein product [Effrenium voratum]|uniref:Photolyase/cryptochrome alpha/beta domain-containing protein n=1 Tax=Effrenium voratum TaxID=2562239 RepID=A0AA36I0N1_9DINO|nr:unnamed protein product [Effrenium voratum]CAJ1445260.1 unnamed protein product [Effrenium voratum]